MGITSELGNKKKIRNSLDVSVILEHMPSKDKNSLKKRRNNSNVVNEKSGNFPNNLTKPD